jgi:SNF2 family DNA or RNA helicase
MSHYPNINDFEFNKEITQKFKKYKIPKRKKTFESICFPKQFQLQIPQQFLAKFMNPHTPYKGILIDHQIGSGKTCTAINVAEQWKYIRRIVVVVPASLIGNFRGELRSLCANNTYLTEKEREKLKNLHPSSEEYKEIILKSDTRIDKYYEIYSYNKFVDLIQNEELNLRNALLIVDEIQNMVSENGVYYRVIYNAIHSAPRDLRIVLLSATPMFDRPVEIALTMNLLRLPYELPTGVEFEKMFIKTIKNPRSTKYSYEGKNLDVFKEMIKGYVSYFRGADPISFPEVIIKYVKCEMSDFQYQTYVTVLEREKSNKIYDRIRTIRSFRKGQILNLPNNFFIGTRLISNIAFPNKGIGEKGFRSFSGKNLLLDNLQTYSIKFYKIIKKVTSASGPVFVYCNFVEYGGIKSFVKALEAQGWKDYTQYGEGRKRFAIMSGNEKAPLKDEIKAVFNQIQNINGSKLKIIVGSSSIKEGYSFKNIQQVHIMEPYWNWSRMQQIIGRAIRYCSHKDLPEDQRFVKVYIYLSTHPNEKETIDQYIAKLANQKNKLINQFDQAIKEIAIDCELFKNSNVFPELGEEPIKCDA